jgi:3-phytase
MGDQNADPYDGDSVPGAINQLLNNPLVNTSKTPSSLGGVEYSLGANGNPNHTGNPAFDTAAFTGGLRVDYVLPSTNLSIADARVFWPIDANPLSSLNSASDHHAVVLDVTTSIPEPSTVLGIIAVGIGGLFGGRKRKSR